MTVLEKLRQLPTWVGILGALAFAVLMTVLAVQLYVHDVIPTAGPVVVVGLAPLLIWLRVSGLRFRTRRRRQALMEQLGNLERLVAAERNQPPGHRASTATDRSLAEAGDLVRAARRLLDANRADAVTVVGDLGPVSERWHGDAPLTRSLHSTVRAAQSLNIVWGEVQDMRSSR